MVFNNRHYLGSGGQHLDKCLRMLQRGPPRLLRNGGAPLATGPSKASPPVD